MKKTRKVLITGIGGYLGSNIASSLLDKGGYEIVGYGRGTKFDLLYQLWGDKIRLIEGLMSEREKFMEASSGCKVLIHTASPLSEKFCEDNRGGAYEQIVDGSILVRDVAKEKGAKFIYISTQAVYSTYEESKLPLLEKDKLLPDTAYGQLKKDAEEKVCKVESIVLRPSYIYGKGKGIPMHSNFLLGIFIHRAEKGEPLIVYGEGKQLMDFIHINDVVEAIVKLSDSSLNKGIFNVSSEVGVTIRSLATLVSKITIEILGKDVTVIYELGHKGKNTSSRVLSNHNLSTAIGWSPKISLKDGIIELLKKDE